jgi:hypothetical protein
MFNNLPEERKFIAKGIKLRIEDLCNFLTELTNIGHTVAYVIKVLQYKPEGRGFDSR